MTRRDAVTVITSKRHGIGATYTRVMAITGAGTFTTDVVRHGESDAEHGRAVNRARSFAYRTPRIPSLLDPRDSAWYYDRARERFERAGWSQ